MNKITKTRRQFAEEAKIAGEAWANAREKASEEAREIVSGMTLGEKIAQLSLYSQYHSNEKDTVEENGEKKMLLRRVGAMIGLSDAELYNSFQERVINDNPNDIPLLDGCDFLHGAKTTYPVPLAQSCTWDPEIARRICEATAKESYDIGCRWTYAPMVDIARDPRWGRIVEGYGEDPLLCSDFAAASVRGFQGDKPGEPGHILSCLKHYVAYGACIGGRDYNSSEVSMQTVFDVYLPSFESGIKTGAETVMSSYQDLGGIPMSANKFMLTDVLRGKLGFEGFVVSDYDSITDLMFHGVAADEREAVYKGYAAGIDMIMQGDYFNDYLPGLIEDGHISEEKVTESAERVVSAKILAGLFENPMAEGTGKYFFSPENIALCRETGSHSLTLLENNGILPLTREKARGKRIAVVGPGVEDKTTPLGAWPGSADIEHTVTVGQGIREAYSDIAEVVCSTGMRYHMDGEAPDVDGAVSLASSADIVIAVVGEHNYDAGESRCRSKLELTDDQIELLSRLKELGKPVISLVQTGRPLVIDSVKETSDAVMVIWETGSEAGHSVADVLTGDFNPCGRLTTSFPTTTGQVPIYYNHRNTGCPPCTHGGMNSHYYDTSVEPLYCFGHGLSYTSFEYSDVKLSENEMSENGSITVTVKVTNTGETGGFDVVQLYVRDVSASMARPVKELADYRKVWVEPGETETVELVINANELSFTNEKLERIVEPGKFFAWVAHDCQDETLSQEFFVK